MGNFMKKMKAAAEQAKIKDHPLFTREYSTEIRNAYFSGAAASLCFLDDELDPEEQHALSLLGQALHLSSDEISEVMKTVQSVGEEDKMEFLQEVFALMDSDYLKYTLLTDIHTLCSKKGKLTEDETDFINASAEILFGEEKNVFELWEKGLTLDNAEKFSVKDDDNSSKPAAERDPFLVKLEERNKKLWTTLIDEAKKDPKFCEIMTKAIDDGFHVDCESFLFSGYDHFRCKFFQELSQQTNVALDKPINPADLEGINTFVSADVALQDLMKMKTIQDLDEVMLNGLANQMTNILTDYKRKMILDDFEQHLLNMHIL